MRKQTIASLSGQEKKGEGGESKNNISGDRFKTIMVDKDKEE
jgi:hypothetical protein